MQSQKNPVGSWQWASQNTDFWFYTVWYYSFVAFASASMTGFTDSISLTTTKRSSDPVKRAWQLDKDPKTRRLQQQLSLTWFRSDPTIVEIDKNVWNYSYNNSSINVHRMPKAWCLFLCSAVILHLWFSVFVYTHTHTHNRTHSWGFT